MPLGLGLDATLAILHHLAFLGLLALLVAERMSLRHATDRAAVLRLVRLDMLYGMTAGVVLAVGACRVVWGLKGPDFYLGNTFFWLKMAAFLGAALLSALPTVRYFRWRRAANAQPAVMPADAERAVTARLVDVQLALLFAMAVFAALMARNYGAL